MGIPTNHLGSLSARKEDELSEGRRASPGPEYLLQTALKPKIKPTGEYDSSLVKKTSDYGKSKTSQPSKKITSKYSATVFSVDLSSELHRGRTGGKGVPK